MDPVTHGAAGYLVARLARLRTRRGLAGLTGLALAPDLPQLVLYPLLGAEKGRPFWFPRAEDWAGLREARPVWAALWEAPHSVFAALAVVGVLLLWHGPARLRFALAGGAAYLSHIVLDIPSHTGEWAVQPFYPLPGRIDGFVDVWASPWPYAVIAWLALALAIAAAEFQSRRR